MTKGGPPARCSRDQRDQSCHASRVAAIAIVQRSEALGGPTELAGRRATIYVPTDDTEFDYRRGVAVEDSGEAEPLIGLRLDYAW